MDTISFVDDSAKFIGYFQAQGPTGYIEGRYRDDVVHFSSKLVRSWPNTIAKKPYRDKKGSWIIKIRTKETHARCAPHSIARAPDSAKAED
jgi:hypothetical protein